MISHKQEIKEYNDKLSFMDENNFKMSQNHEEEINKLKINHINIKKNLNNELSSK